MGGGRLAVLGGAAGVRRAWLYEATGWFGAVRLTSLDYRGGFETADAEAAGGRGGCRGQATCAEAWTPR